jgi:hypothetical protein
MGTRRLTVISRGWPSRAQRGRRGQRCAILVATLAVTGFGNVTPAAAPAAQGTTPVQWRVTTLPPPAGGGAHSYAEPGIAIDSHGTALANAATANTVAPPTLWVSRDGASTWAAGRDFDNTGASTGDADAAIGADGYLYALNLAFNPNPPGQPANPTVFVYRSRDGGTWSGPGSFPPPHGADQPDRPWLITDPHHPADVDVVNSEGGGNIVMWRSHDHGATFAGPIPVTGGANSQAALALSSRPLFDPVTDGRIVMLYETATPAGLAVSASTGTPVYEFPLTQLWTAVSSDAGQTWSNRQVLDTATLPDPTLLGGTLGHLLVASAIDARGRLYAAFSLRPSTSTETSIYLVHSVDHGVTWSPPVKVDAPTLSNVMPALAVSRAGVAYLSWYGSAASDFRSSTAGWSEMVAASSDPLASRPKFAVSQISGPVPVHIGGIDTAGAIGSDLGDNWGLRDFQSIAVDGCGRPHPVWSVDNGRSATQTASPALGCTTRG